MTQTVLVSGGSGYIAGFTIRQLIEQGWTVHTTIRHLAREAEVRRALATDNGRLRFFAADLMHDAGWAEAMAGAATSCTWPRRSRRARSRTRTT